jgi:hypothetical protein
MNESHDLSYFEHAKIIHKSTSKLIDAYRKNVSACSVFIPLSPTNKCGLNQKYGIVLRSLMQEKQLNSA